MTDPIQSPRLLDLTPSTPAQVTAALAYLTRHNATDLTDALGLTTTSPDTTTTGRRPGRNPTPHLPIAYAATRDLRAVQELLGHASPTTTAVYAAVPDGAVRAAVEAAAS